MLKSIFFDSLCLQRTRRVENSLGNDFYVKIMNLETIMINSCFDTNPSLSSFGYFFVPGPLGHLKFVPEEVFRSTDSIDNVSLSICRESKNEIFLRSVGNQLRLYCYYD